MDTAVVLDRQFVAEGRTKYHAFSKHLQEDDEEHGKEVGAYLKDLPPPAVCVLQARDGARLSDVPAMDAEARDYYLPIFDRHSNTPDDRWQAARDKVLPLLQGIAAPFVPVALTYEKWRARLALHLGAGAGRDFWRARELIALPQRTVE